MKKNINNLFKEKGWIIKEVIPESKILSKMLEIESEKTRAKEFTKYSIVPAEMALEGKSLIPKGSSYLVYIIPTEEYRKKYDHTIIRVYCEDKKTGESKYIYLQQLSI